MNKMQLRKFLSQVRYRDWEFVVDEMGDGCFLQATFAARDHATGYLCLQKGRKWYISPHATPSEVVQTAFLAVKTALEHELREEFTFNDRAIFGPHFDVRALEELRDRGALEVRP